MINNIYLAIGFYVTVTYEDHGVIRETMAGFAPVEQNVARLSTSYVSADQEGIELSQCPSVGELGKGTICQIWWVETTWLDAEDLRAQRCKGH